MSKDNEVEVLPDTVEQLPDTTADGTVIVGDENRVKGVRGKVILREQPLTAGFQVINDSPEAARDMSVVGSTVLDGLADTAGMPVDLPNLAGAAGNWAIGNGFTPPFGDEPPMGSEYIRKNFTPERVEAESGLGRVAQNIGRGVTANVAGAGLIRSAGGLLKTAPEAVRALRISQMFERASDKLASLSPRELYKAVVMPPAVAGVGGEMGGTVGGWINGEKGRAVGNILGQLSASVGHAVTTKTLKRFADWRKDTLPRLASQPTETEMKTRLARMFEDEYTKANGPEADLLEDLKSGIAERDLVREGLYPPANGMGPPSPGDALPGYSPTTAAVLPDGDAKYVFTRHELSLKDKIPQMGAKYNQHRAQTANAVSDAVETVPFVDPSDPGSMANVRERIHTHVDDAIDAAARAAEEEVNVGQGRGSVRPGAERMAAVRPTDAQLGAALRKHIDDARILAKIYASKLYAGINGKIMVGKGGGYQKFARVVRANARLNEFQDKKNVAKVIRRINKKLTDAIKAEVDKRLAASEVGEEASKGARKVLRRKVEKEMAISFKSLREMRSELLDEFRSAKWAGKDDKARRLKNVIDGVEDLMGDIARNPETAGEAAKFRTAQAYYKDLVARFDDSNAFDVLRKTKKGTRYILDENAIGDQFFVQGKEGAQAAHQAVRAGMVPVNGGWAPNPVFRERLNDYARNLAAQAAFDEKKGRATAQGLANFRHKYKEALAHPFFADVERETRTLEGAQRMFEQRAADLSRTQREIETSAVAAMLNEDPGDLVKQFRHIFSSGRGKSARQRMEQAWKMVEGNPNAERGFKRSLREYVLKEHEAGNGQLPDNTWRRPPTNATNMRDFLKTNREALLVIYSPKDLRDLDLAESIWQKFESTSKILGHKGSPTSPLLQGVPSDAASTRYLLHGLGLAVPIPGFIKSGLIEMLGKRAADITGPMWDELRAEAYLNPEALRDLISWYRAEKPVQTIERLRFHLLTLGHDLSDEPGFDPDDDQASEPDDDGDEEGYPSPAFIEDGDLAFPSYTDQQPPPKNAPQIAAAETKRLDAADRVVTSARKAAMNAPKVAQEMRSKGVSISDITKRSSAARSKPFEDLVKRSSGDLQHMLAVLEALKPDELDLVREKAQPMLDKLLEAEPDDLTAADATARADALFAPPAEEGAA